MSAASAPFIRLFGLICFFFLLLQLWFFYHVSISLDGISNASSTSVASDPVKKDEEQCTTQSVALDLPCAEITVRNLCDYRNDCFSIYGTSCGSVLPEETFLQCKPNYEMRKVKKMQVNPRIPNWSYGHSDYKSICAHAPDNPKALYRFTNFIPDNWIQKKCVDCTIHPQKLPIDQNTGLSLVTLVHREFDSFNNSLHSWRNSGLLNYAQETIVWINAKSEENDAIEKLALDFGLTVMSSPTNVGIGAAVSRLVLAAKNPLVIFLEKDWEVIEPHSTIVGQLEYAKRLIYSNVNGSRADAVKLRSRFNAGEPNIDPQLCIPPEYDNEELNEWAQFRWFEDLKDHRWWLPHLFCNLFHYRTDTELLGTYPNRVWKCGSALCFDSAQCGWTNNPIIFKKHWFLDTLYDISQREDNPTFEGGTYYSHEWIDPHWVIAELAGFFRHHEINEHL